MASLFEVHAQAIQWLRFTIGFPATVTKEALHDTITIFIRAGFTAVSRAAMAVHLDLSRPSLYSGIESYRIPLKAKAFGCALPVLETLTGLLFTIVSYAACLSASRLFSHSHGQLALWRPKQLCRLFVQSPQNTREFAHLVSSR